MTNYGLWASCKLVRDAADALFEAAAFETDDPQHTPLQKDIAEVQRKLQALENAIAVLFDYLPPFDA